ncbi:uncharacterized protein LOC141606281 [Silene latifolia]|uniref:uncharacterized protein LOC141606281 n=1 Tax=Silene latifolia TaxID=37657 RepID=UPI003D777034
MRKISIILKQSGNIDGDQAANFLASSSDKLSYAATSIKKQAQTNRNLAGKVLRIMYILTSTTIGLSLGFATALTVFGVLRFRRVVYTLVILCWILTIICWMLFGTYFVIERLSGDTCTALQDFRQNPDNNSLSIILPCNELLSVGTVLTDVSTGLFEVINQVNSEISTLRANSLPGLKYVCNPFSGPPDFRYQPKDCPAHSIPIGDFPKELKMFTCSDTGEAKCKEGFITISEYNVIEAYTTPVQNLLDTYPEMENLVNCQLVKDAFSDILVHYCKPLKKHIKTIYVSMLLLSIAMMVLVSTWTSTTRHEQHFLNGSVKPNIEQ